MLAFLERREQPWTLGMAEAEALRRGGTAQEQLLGIFDVLDYWLPKGDLDAAQRARAMACRLLKEYRWPPAPVSPETR